jgi:hypothetical protein
MEPGRHGRGAQTGYERTTVQTQPASQERDGGRRDADDEDVPRDVVGADKGERTIVGLVDR